MSATRHLLYVLALMEAALCVLAAAGQAVVAVNVLYAMPGLWLAMLFVVAGITITQRHVWGAVVLLVLESVRLLGFSFSAALGLLPWVQLPLTGATLVDGLLLPIAVMLLVGRALSEPTQGAA